MSILIETKRSVFFNELTDDLRKKYFDLKKSKYLHNIDTLYYSVFLKNDSNDDECVSHFIEDIKSSKESLLSSGEESFDFVEGFEILRGRHSDYAHRLSVRDCYDIFVTTHIRNSNTPRIMVQIRSFYLWTEGIEKSIYQSFDRVTKLLNYYGLQVDRVQENRIDYAFHTNCIQSPNKYFSLEKLKSTCCGSLTRFKLIGDLHTKNNDYDIEYFSLGTHNSNNLFFRTYHKSKEVVEMNYKSFFFDIWFDNGLINFYDKYCYEYAYKIGRYDKIYEGMLKFYLDFGQDIILKQDINLLLRDTNAKFEDIKSFACSIMPPVTKVLNIEFETKRKYYYYYQDAIEILPHSSKVSELDKLFKIVENRKIFIDMLTENVVCFKKDEKYLDFWRRLKSVKIKSLSNDKIKANYNTSVDLDKLLKRALNSVMSYSVHKSNLSDDIVTDFIDVLANLNDNDIASKDFRVVDIDTGEVINIYNSVLKSEYKYKKNKKYKQIKNRLK